MKAYWDVIVYERRPEGGYGKEVTRFRYDEELMAYEFYRHLVRLHRRTKPGYYLHTLTETQVRRREDHDERLMDELRDRADG